MAYELKSKADHILDWAHNSQIHYRRLKGLAPGNFIRESGRALAAMNLALHVVEAMHQKRGRQPQRF